MNIKNLRKNYKTLSLIERHSLFLSAIIRNDETELNADRMRLRRKCFKKCRILPSLCEEVLSLLMIVMIYKAGRLDKLATVWRTRKPKGRKHHSCLAALFFFCLFGCLDSCLREAEN